MLDNALSKNIFINISYDMKDVLELVKIQKDIEFALQNPDILSFSQEMSIPVVKPRSVIKSVLLFGVFFLVIGFFISFLRQ